MGFDTTQSVQVPFTDHQVGIKVINVDGAVNGVEERVVGGGCRLRCLPS